MAGMEGMTGYDMPDVYAWAFNSSQKCKPLLNAGPTAKDFLRHKYVNGCVDMGIMETGIYRLMGWAFDFRPFLRRFVYKQYGQWWELYAPDKTMVRKAVHGRITEIVEVKNV
jgi:hypothetical protein